MLLNRKIERQARKLLGEVESANWNPIFINVLTTLLDREKSARDLEEEIPALKKLMGDRGSVESAQASYIFGFLIQYGLGVPSINKELAAECLAAAANAGVAEAQVKFGNYLLGLGISDGYEDMREYIKRDLDLGMRYIRAAEKQGYASAKCTLAVCYADGRGIKKDLKLAMEYFVVAAKQSDAEAQRTLGYFYNGKVEIEGLKLEKDLKRAAEYFALAAAQGDASAQTELGYCYMYGKGVEVDLKRGVEWLRLAAEQENAAVQWTLRKNPRSKTDSRSWTLAVSQIKAKRQLGRLYQDGFKDSTGQVLIREDLKRAVEYYRQGVEKINLEKIEDHQSLLLLASCYKKGYGVSQDPIRAVLLSEASGCASSEELARVPDYLKNLNQDLDLAYCQSTLEKDVKTEAEKAVMYSTIGFCYQLGLRRTPKDLRKAAAFYTEAVNRSAPEALWDLFSCYREMLSSDEVLARGNKTNGVL